VCFTVTVRYVIIVVQVNMLGLISVKQCKSLLSSLPYFLLVALVSCGDSVPESTRKSLERQIGIHNRTTDLLEKAQLAEDISKRHWDSEQSEQWLVKSRKHKSAWRVQYCGGNGMSPREENLLSELDGYPKPHRENDWHSISRTYGSLYALCGEKTYAELYGEYASLAKFASIKDSICGLTVNPSVLGNVIRGEFADFAPISEDEARELGLAASKGYGECQCVLHDHFKIKDNISIGFCIGKDYQDCRDEAYCGATADRIELAEKLDGYQYKFPGVSDPYADYSPTGFSPSSYSQALEWGKVQTEALVRDYCSSTADC